MTSRRRRRCAPSAETGSVVVGLAVVGLVLSLMVGVAAVGVGVAARLQAANGADAAALAAAPVTFRPFGAHGTPVQEAARFAAMNGTRLVRCVCPVDASWRTRTVSVIVARELPILGIGTVEITAASRATFEPVALIPRG